MPIDLPQAQLNFYHKFHHLELESFFADERLGILQTAVKDEIKKRLGQAPSNTSEAYMGGRDLWRDNTAIRQLVCNRDLALCATKLSQQPSLVLAFDQLLFTPLADNIAPFDHPHTLQEISNVSSLACGLVINLCDCETTDGELSLSVEEDLSMLTPTPHNPGSILFFSPEMPLNFQDLFATPSQTHLLIAYANVKPLYIQNKIDPHAHALKKLGYGLGDHLATKTHPLLIK